MTVVSSVGENEYVFDADPQDIGILKHVLGDRLNGEGRAKPIRPSLSLFAVGAVHILNIVEFMVNKKVKKFVLEL